MNKKMEENITTLADYFQLLTSTSAFEKVKHVAAWKVLVENTYYQLRQYLRVHQKYLPTHMKTLSCDVDMCMLSAMKLLATRSRNYTGLDIDEEIEDSMKPPSRWILSLKYDHLTWEEQVEESRQLSYVETKEDYDRELEDGLHEQMQAYENNLQSLQRQASELRSQLTIEVEKREMILRNAKAHDKYLLAKYEENLRTKNEQFEEKHRVQKDQVRYLKMKLEKVNEKLASSERARQVLEAEKDDRSKQVENLRIKHDAAQLKQIPCLEVNIVKLFPPASPHFEERKEKESALSNEALGEERMNSRTEGPNIFGGYGDVDYDNDSIRKENIAEEEKERKPLRTEGPFISNEYGKEYNEEMGKDKQNSLVAVPEEYSNEYGNEFIEEVGKAKQNSLVPVPEGLSEIHSKSSMAVKTEDDKAERTMEPMVILSDKNEGGLHRWTINAVWRMKPADKGGGNCKKDWTKKWSRFLEAVT